MKRTVWNVSLILLSTLVSLVVAEYSLRVISPQQLGIWYTLRDGTVIHPPSFDAYMRDFDQQIHFNSFGMRDREHVEAHRPEDGFRVLVLGDSFMEAQQVAFGDSFTSLLEGYLHDKLHHTVEVINCSVSGWAQDEELVYLDRYGRRFTPDLIVVAMTLHNDIQENLEEQYHSIQDEKLVMKPVENLPSAELAVLRLKQFLSSHSHLWQLARKFRYSNEIRQKSSKLDGHVLRLIAKGEPAPEIEKGWRLTFGLFSRIHDIGKGFGARTVVMLIPLRIQLEQAALAEFLVNQGVRQEDVQLERPQEAMNEFGRVTGIDIIDLRQPFRAWVEKRQASLHLPEGHWNTNGHKLAAEIVADELIRRKIVLSNGLGKAG